MNDSANDMPSGLKERRALLEHLLQQELKTESFPLSFGQEGLWFLNQLEPNSPAYNISRLLRFKGELNVQALVGGLNRIIERHESLRTRFEIREEKPCQIVTSQSPLVLLVEDLSSLSGAEQRPTVLEIAHAEAERSFDLRQGSLVRARLLRLTATEHVLLLCLHHLICDGWSMPVLFAELEKFYNSACKGAEAQLTELPIQYADYAIWQRERLQGEVLEGQLAYWRRQLSGVEAVLEMPVDRARSAVQSYRGSVERWQLSWELTKGLKQLGQQQGASLFMVLVAAFQTLLWRYTGQKDVVVGTAVANRQQPEVENLIGFLVNTLALRSRVEGSESFKDFLTRVKETCLSAYGHQELPFEKLVKELQPERSMAHAPLFQVLLTMQDAARNELNLYQLETQVEVIHNAASKCDLSLYVNHQPSHGLELWLEYNAELLEAVTTKELLLHYERLLEEIVFSPQQRVGDLSFLSSSEKHKLLVDWNLTKTDYPRDSCITKLFEAEAERRPESIALRFGDEQLTYRELNHRANQLARYLCERGVVLEDKVAVMLNRSIDLAMSLLAVLKAGGAYVPLDPEYPQERLSLIVKDAAAKLVITESAFRERTYLDSSRVIVLVEEWEQIRKLEDHNLESPLDANNLAYLIYTSGSTGRPKGVAVSHRNVVRLVKNTNYVELGPEEVLLLLASINFDASTFEIWGSLLNGAMLAIMPPGPFTMEELGKVIKRYKVTTLWLTAGVFHQMVGERVEDLSSLHQVLAGGDVLSPLHVENFLAKATHSTLINGYGPTENTTFTCTYSIARPASFQTSVPIGRPIANSSAYILNREMHLVPRGVWGELYAGGDGVARCYLNQPELTAASFVPDPFSAERGARLYRTGDLARYLPTGDIEFRGRLDQQVKVRGFRIEPQEIESVLCQHEAVANCVVIAREDVPGDQRLIAYIVPNECPIETDNLRNYLSEKIPQYMIPTNFVTLAKLPLMTSGKVDRRALPVPEINRAESGSFVAPRGQTEQELVEIWAELLRITPIGVQDNFFDLGGHSLLATQMVSRILRNFAVELKLQDIFNAPTVEGIAALVDSALIEMSGDSGIDAALGVLEQLADD